MRVLVGVVAADVHMRNPIRAARGHAEKEEDRRDEGDPRLIERLSRVS
jgi:hypothetical protein